MNLRYLKQSRRIFDLFHHEPFSIQITKPRNVHLSSSLLTKSSQCVHSKQAELKSENEKQSLKGRRLLQRTAKGTFDRHSQQMALQQYVLDIITAVFQKHGAETIDTPVFEYKDVLTEKYGEESKLIYDFVDEGGETLAMRYDFTVPLARYVAMHKVGSIKRYQIGKVYRRDEPNLKFGRYCEFLQCDFDIVGPHDPMIPDAECVKIISEILNSLNIGDYVIKLNHRQLLEAILITCGVPSDKFRAICSAVDKLDKRSWCEVRQEMVEDKGLDGAVADKIGEYVQLNGSYELIDKLLNDEQLKESSSAVSALESMRLLLKYCEIFGLQNRISFDLSLTRGLDYYTGAIIEAVLKDKNGQHYGSIAAGGRYDDLIGMFDVKGKSIPCVGVSVGIERILLLLEQRFSNEDMKLRTNQADVFVVTPHRGLGEERLKLVNKLWDAGIRCENSTKLSPKLLLQLQHCEDFRIPLALIIGATEIERGVVKIKDTATREETEVSIDGLVEEIRKRLAKFKNN